MTDVMQSGRKLDESGLEQLLAGLTAVRGGDFSTRLPETGDPLIDQIATVFNGMADQLTCSPPKSPGWRVRSAPRAAWAARPTSRGSPAPERT